MNYPVHEPKLIIHYRLKWFETWFGKSLTRNQRTRNTWEMKGGGKSGNGRKRRKKEVGPKGLNKT